LCKSLNFHENNNSKISPSNIINDSIKSLDLWPENKNLSDEDNFYMDLITESFNKNKLS